MFFKIEKMCFWYLFEQKILYITHMKFENSFKFKKLSVKYISKKYY